MPPGRPTWHNGGTGGFASYVALLPGADAEVVVLTNTARPVDRLGVRLLQQLGRPDQPAL